MFEAIESFEWMTPEFKTVDAGKNKIRIRGIALRGGATTRNNRKYTSEDLKRAARSFIGKPITVNHDDTKIVGDVKWMEWNDADDTLEYFGEIKKQPYVSMIRGGNAEIRGVSIQGNYLKNLCVHCGREFLDDDGLWTHLQTDHLVKNFSTQPWGLYGAALSLVLDPEVPGYSDTSIEVMEYYKPALRLLETVITKRIKIEEKKKTNKANIHVQANSTLAIGKAKIALKTAEQDHQCPEGEHWSEEQGKCVVDVAEQEECPEGQHRDAETGECVPDKPPAEPQKKAEEESDQPPAMDKQLDTPPCPEGSHYDADLAKCVPDTEIPAAPVIEQPATEKLQLGEPFADYDDFADCVSKNQDKEDPEAYCASIEREVEGEPASEKVMDVTWSRALEKHLLDDKYWKQDTAHSLRVGKASRKLLIEALQATRKRQKQLQNNILKVSGACNNVNTAFTELTGNVNEAMNKQHLSFTEVLQKTLEYNKQQNRMLKQKLTSLDYVKPAQLKEALEKVNWKQDVAEVSKRVEEALGKFDGVIGKMDEEYVKYKGAMDKKISELETKNMDQQKQLQEKKVEETVAITERIENVEAKLDSMARYKGKVKIKQKEESTDKRNPYTGK